MDMETKILNFVEHLQRIAKDHPAHLAAVIQKFDSSKQQVNYTEITFQDLNARSDQAASGLEQLGIRPGVRTVLMVPPGIEFFLLTFALFKVGAIPILVDPGMGIKNLKKCLAQAQPQAFIGIPKAQLARAILGWGKDTIDKNKIVTVGKKFLWGGTTLDQLMAKASPSYTMQPIAPDETSAILFTSGSTGPPKGTVYTHRMFNTQIEILRDDYGIEPGEMDVATFPLFALFGPALGMTAIIPDMDASQPLKTNPNRIVQAVHDYKATNLFCSPALIELVGQHGEKMATEGQPIQLHSLRRVISAGAPAHPESLRRFSKLLKDDIDILTSYGATEALPVSYISARQLFDGLQEKTAAGAGICVGKPVREVEVKIIRITDDPIPTWSDDLILAAGEMGEITVKGQMASREYFQRNDSTALAKIVDEGDGGFYHRMGDIGYFDEQGRLWMCGRKGHRVVLRSGTLFTISCERIFDTHPQVKRTALVGVEQAGDTIPVLCVELMPGVNTALEKIKSELLEVAQQHPNTAQITTILFHKKFPVDIRHNAKIFREKLVVWAQEQLSK